MEKIKKTKQKKGGNQQVRGKFASRVTRTVVGRKYWHSGMKN